MKRLLPLMFILLSPSLLFADYIAMVIGDGVRLRDEANTTSKVAGTANTGDFATIFEHTEERVNLNGEDECDAYYWYRIRVNSKTEGWIYGNFLYKLSINKEKYRTPESMIQIVGKEVFLNGKTYRFDFAYNTNIGAINDGGLTGCEEIYIPFLVEEKTNTVLFFHGRSEATCIGKRKAGNEIVLFGSDGCHAQITDLHILGTNGSILIEATTQFQEGKEKYWLYARPAGDHFDVYNTKSSGTLYD